MLQFLSNIWQFLKMAYDATTLSLSLLFSLLRFSYNMLELFVVRALIPSLSIAFRSLSFVLFGITGTLGWLYTLGQRLGALIPMTFSSLVLATLAAPVVLLIGVMAYAVIGSWLSARRDSAPPATPVMRHRADPPPPPLRRRQAHVHEIVNPHARRRLDFDQPAPQAPSPIPPVPNDPLLVLSQYVESFKRTEHYSKQLDAKKITHDGEGLELSEGHPWVCPISFEVANIPVRIKGPNKQVFDYHYLVKMNAHWPKKHPLTNAPFYKKDIEPAFDVKDAIEKLLNPPPSPMPAPVEPSAKVPAVLVNFERKQDADKASKEDASLEERAEQSSRRSSRRPIKRRS